MSDIIDVIDENDDFFEADIFITPPDEGNITPIDSDNEDFPDGNLSHFSGAQLMAEATTRIRTREALCFPVSFTIRLFVRFFSYDLLLEKNI